MSELGVDERRKNEIHKNEPRMNQLRMKELRANGPRMNEPHMNELKLLVEWSSPWAEFVTAIRPALARSPKPLDAEAQSGLFPYRGILAAWVLEIALFVLVILLPAKLGKMRPLQAAAPPKYDVIYFSGDELPQTEDAGGAQSGRSGKSGGREGHHATQVIRVARGASVREKVVDAPKLNLPHSDSAVANLLAYKSIPGPPPTGGLKSSVRGVEMPATAVPPPTDVQQERLHASPVLEASVIAPTPSELQHELVSRHVRGSQAEVIPPPVSAPNEITNLHPQLTLPRSMIIPPSPVEREASSMNARRGNDQFHQQMVVPPAADAGSAATNREPLNNLGNAAVVAPAAELNQVSRTHRKAGNLSGTSVVPPPAQLQGSSLGREENGLSAGIVPPPVQMNGSSLGREKNELSSNVVPPPAQVNSSSGRRGKNGLSAGIVPPPAQMNGSSLRRDGNRLSAGTSVVPPPSQVNGSAFGREKNELSSNVVPPPAQVSSSSGRREENGLSTGAAVVPPPAQVTGASLRRQQSEVSGGTAVVPPAPSASGASASGNGRGRRGPANTIAEEVTPPSNAAASGIVLSNKPGSKVAAPAGSAGSLAMSPSGGAQPGLGGTGGGSSISNGSDTGSSTSGQGPGAKTSGAGHGSSEIAHNGISPFPGTGGAGKGATAPPTMPGVSVSGGQSNAVKLPSFGEDGKPLDDPAHSPAIKSPDGPGITIVATSHSGGAFNFYGALKGDKVYTIYIDTAAGPAVMQFADPKSATQSYPEDLTPPQALRADLPADLQVSRVVISCTLDRTGLVRSPRVVDTKSADVSAKILAALPSWKFRPAFRGSQPIDVTVILGFDIDTN